MAFCTSHFNLDKQKNSKLPFGKLTWQWNMDLLKIYSLLNMGMTSSARHVSWSWRVNGLNLWISLQVTQSRLKRWNALWSKLGKTKNVILNAMRTSWIFCGRNQTTKLRLDLSPWFQSFILFYPDPWGKWFNLTSIFFKLNGLKPPTSCCFCCAVVVFFRWKLFDEDMARKGVKRLGWTYQRRHNTHILTY